MCRFRALGLAGVVCAPAHTEGGPWATRGPVGGVVAAPERAQQRLALAVEARLLGHGGVRAVAQVAGVSETTVRKGGFELEAGQAPLPPGRVRRPGGGRKSATRQDPDLIPALLALVEPDERGDPMSPLRWTTKSLR